MNKILDKTIGFIQRTNKIDELKLDIIRYGLEILILKVIFALCALLYGILTNQFVECVLFLNVFVPLRSFAGGYHSKTRWGCAVSSFFMLAISLELAQLLYVNSQLDIIMFIVLAVVAVLMWQLCPVDCENKILTKSECKAIGVKVRLLLSIIILILCALYMCDIKEAYDIALMAIVDVGILVSLGWIENK